MSETTIMKIAEWAHGVSYEDIPERVREKARLQMFSVLAAIHASARHELGEIILSGVESWAGDGPCTIVPTGKKVDILSAVYANAALSIALDYDDYLLFGHTGHSAVCASLAVAEREDRSLKDALVAQVIANEIEGRLGASVVMGPHNGQAWSHIHLAGSAAATAKLLGLGLEETGHAIGISLYQPTYTLMPGFMGPDSKATTAANPSVIGIQAAFLASKGATGPLDIIEHPQGFLARLSYVPAPFFITGLGRAWVTDTLAYKIYPGCAYIDTTVDAVLKIREQYEDDTGKELDPDDVTEILVEATAFTVEMDNLSKTGGKFDPLNPVSINFSIPGNVAIALIKGRLTADDLTKSALEQNAEKILEISKKVKLEHDWGMTTKMLAAMDKVLKLRKIMGEVKLTDLAGLRSRIQKEYKSSMGLNLSEMKKIWDRTPDAGSRLFKGVKDRVQASIKKGASASSKNREPYDLGLCPLEKFTMPFTARVTVTNKKGIKISYQQDIPRGGPGHPLDKTREYVLDKYLREAGKTMENARVQSFLESASDPESKISARMLLEKCCHG